MADAPGAPEADKEGEDPSMEDILQSIRDIIADDEDPEAMSAETEDTKKEDATDEAPVAAADAPKEEPTEPVGSDLLELSEDASEEGVLELTEEMPDETAAQEPQEAAGDVLSAIDDALAEPEPAATVAAEPAPTAAEHAPTPAPSPKADAVADEPLLSDDAKNQASASIDKLKNVGEDKPAPVETTPAPQFRSGSTVEDMVVEFLRPMMKEWLDGNLPTIVERVVETEVKRLTRN